MQRCRDANLMIAQHRDAMLLVASRSPFLVLQRDGWCCNATVGFPDAISHPCAPTHVPTLHFFLYLFSTLDGKFKASITRGQLNITGKLEFVGGKDQFFGTHFEGWKGTRGAWRREFQWSLKPKNHHLL